MAAQPQTVLAAPGGDLVLHRVPRTPDPNLRAWDGADLLVLEHLAEVGLPADLAPGATLLCNDTFGALGVALAAQRPQSWSDSWLSGQALTHNLTTNDLPADAVEHVPSTQDPTGPFSLVVIKVPRTLALLRDQLLRLSPLLAPDAVVVGAGMVKHVHTSTIDAFEDAVGPTTTSRAKRKARLLFATVDPDRSGAPSPYPTTFEHDGIVVTNHANVFARERLDLGTRLLLDHLPEPAGEVDVVDLGCGNGVVGAVAALADPGRDLLYADESYGAVASALATHAGARDVGPVGAASGHLGNAAQALQGRSADLIICNPPFHAQGARVDHVASVMFRGAAKALRPDGTFVVVGNRHLGHHETLRRDFLTVEVLGSDEKFVVLRATGPRHR